MRSLRFTGGVWPLDTALVQGSVGGGRLDMSSTPTWSRPKSEEDIRGLQDDQRGKTTSQGGLSCEMVECRSRPECI